MKYAIENGIIELSYIQEMYDMSKREEALNRHPYKIWEGNNGRFYTYLPDNSKKRVLKSRGSRKEIEDCVYAYWKEEMENPTIFDVYQEWIGEKLSREEITITTKNRYDRQYNETMVEFGKRRIKSVEEYDIEKFVLNAIHSHRMTAKGFSNLRTIIFGVFKLAKKKKYITYSITEVIADIEISKKMFKKNIKEDDELVFMDDEKKKLFNYFENKEMDLKDLGILLLFYTGMRPGELSAIQWEDVAENAINVHRTEIRYENEDGKYVYEVRDFPKTEAGIRKVIIPNSSLWILEKIRELNPKGKYVFEQNGVRIRTCIFDDRLRRICDKLEIKEKSLNKIRKTYATTLIDKKVDESLIISQMGHTDIETTKTYYYKNNKSLEQKSAIIDSVFD